MVLEGISQLLIWWNLGLEAVKLVLQFGCAIFIAWKAVRWAQIRYQKEKHWERRLAAYSDIATALGTLWNILAEWESQELERRGPRGASEEELGVAYWNARRKLEEAHSIAMLILDPVIAATIHQLKIDFDQSDAEDYPNFIYKVDAELGMVNEAREKIINFGRADLELETQPWARKKAIKSSSKA